MSFPGISKIFLILNFFLLAISPTLSQDLPFLFDDSARGTNANLPQDAMSVRARPVSIDTEALTADVHRYQGMAIALNLFDDTNFTAIATEFTENTSGSLTWSGYLDELELSSVMLVVNPDGIVFGNIKFPGAFYQIRYVGKGQHAIYELDESTFPPDAEPIPVYPSDNESERGQQPQSRADSGAVIDVLVVYTPAARSAAGGTSAMNALIDLAVSETNASYNNSNVNTSLNLVHKAEISYTESSSFSTDLNRFSGKTDGYMDGVHALRDQYCADESVLIINNTQYCGIAHLMTSVSASFENRAFSVVARVCATGYYSFGHEIGHNMGCRHDWYVDSGTSPYTYNHAYVNVSDRWRTVMAYNSRCSASGVNCTRIQYWSNPNVNYNGDPMGVGGSSSGSAADNARALNNSRVTVANFRDSNAANCGTVTTPPPTCNGTNYSGSLSGTGNANWQPNGTYYRANQSGNHSGDLTGPSGANFDLFLYKWNGSGWGVVASSTGSSSSESISYNGTSGYYAWRVVSDSGSGSYSLCLDTP